jgi:hypothetical protein
MTENSTPNQDDADKPLKIFSVAMTALMSALELARMAFLQRGTLRFSFQLPFGGTVIGLFVGEKT